MIQEEFLLVFLGTIILPVMLFIIGYVVNTIREIMAGIKRRKNLRYVFFKELRENHDLLNPYLPAKKGSSDEEHLQNLMTLIETDIPLLLVDICRGLSTSVWDKFLDQIDVLSEDDADKIYDSYTAISLVLKDAERVSRYHTSKDLYQLPMYSLALLSRSSIAIEKTRIALGIFEGDGGKSTEVYLQWRNKLDDEEASEQVQQRNKLNDEEASEQVQQHNKLNDEGNSSQVNKKQK